MMWPFKTKVITIPVDNAQSVTELESWTVKWTAYLHDFSNHGIRQDIRQGFNIYKDPATGDGSKKSLKGFQFVYEKDGEYFVESEVSEEKAFSKENLLRVIYSNGKFFNQTKLTEIKNKLNA